MKSGRVKLFAALCVISLVLASCDKGKTSSSLSDGQLLGEFSEPGAKWRAKPFWAWNGDLDEEELKRQVGVFKEMGFGGYFMHSRVGLQTEYLGDEWFRLVGAVAQEGARLGLESYLYDEDRWPSGIAGGYVTMDPGLRIHYMTLRILPNDSSLSFPEGLVAAFVCELDGYSYSGLQRVHSCQEAREAQGGSVLLFTLHEGVRSDVFNGYTYLDPMNRKATDRFISLTHEAYGSHLGSLLGNEIRGIFTDEPHRGHSFTSFGEGSDPMKVAWTEELPILYKERYSEDLTESLPRLFLREEGRTYDPVKWRWCCLTQELFIKNFVIPQHEWCLSHGIAYTGHFLHEDNLTSQVVNQGSLMRAYEHQDIPGVDVLTQYNRNYWVVKQAASVARQMGRGGVLSELYGCGGWQMSFQDYKESGDWQTLFGVNLRCPHLSWYTMKGEAKRDYPASIFFQSGWYRDWKYVEDYYSRLALMLSQGESVCDLVVISPIESVFAQVGVDSFSGLAPATHSIHDIERRYLSLLDWIESAHVDFDFADEEMMSRLASVETRSGIPRLKIGEASYKAVLVGNMATIRSSTLEVLKRFAAAGGEIILAGQAPFLVDVTKSDEASDFLREASSHVVYDAEGIAGAALRSAGKVAGAADVNGTEIGDIFVQGRISGDRKVFLFMNMSTDKSFQGTRLTFAPGGWLSEWDCRRGEVYNLGRNPGVVVRDFAPSQEHLFVVSSSPLGDVPQPDGACIPFPVREAYEYSLSEPNVLPLDMASCKVGGTVLSSEMEVLKIDRSLRDRLCLKRRGGDMLQPWFRHKFGLDSAGASAPVQLDFTFEVESVPSGEVSLCMESASDFEVIVNGHRLDVSSVDGWWIDPCFGRFPLPSGLLVKGRNRITLKTVFSREKELETLYLTGDFGVRLQGGRVVITSLPKSLRIGDITRQGLPFYSGTVSYNLGHSGEGMMDIPRFGGACVRLRKGSESRMVAFAPFRGEVPEGEEELWLDVVLTRRNTFGPLHQLPEKTSSYGPESFVTSGASWSQDYVLLPSGLIGE